jgi:hypothetical protein
MGSPSLVKTPPVVGDASGPGGTTPPSPGRVSFESGIRAGRHLRFTHLDAEREARSGRACGVSELIQDEASDTPCDFNQEGGKSAVFYC